MIERLDEPLRIDPPPVGGASPEALSAAFDAGRAAGSAGHPPTPPAHYAILAAKWSEGWQRGAERRKPSGWRALNIDYEWKSHG